MSDPAVPGTGAAEPDGKGAPTTEDAVPAADGGTPGGSSSPEAPKVGFPARARHLVQAIREGDDSDIERTVLALSEAKRWLAPLAFVIGAFAMLYEGLRLLFSNWRLMLIEVLPAMWIWVALLDLKAHALHGKTFHVLRGPVLIPLVLAVMAITAATFFLNAVFAFAIAKPGPPQIHQGFREARSHLGPVLAVGSQHRPGPGVLHTRRHPLGKPWFGLSLGIVVGVMMLTYVAVPSRMVGIKTTYSKRDKFMATAVGGAIGAVVCAPPYLIGRLGILCLGSKTLFILGVILLSLGLTLQAGASGAVKAIKMSAKLVAGTAPTSPGAPVPDTAVADP